MRGPAACSWLGAALVGASVTLAVAGPAAGEAPRAAPPPPGVGGPDGRPFPDPLPGGRYRLRLYRSASCWQDLGVAAAGTETPPKSLVRGATLTGEVRDGDAPAGSGGSSGLRVRVERLSDGPAAAAVASEAVS